MLETYLTVQTHGQAELMIQKSRFIGHIKRTETEEEAQEFINQIKKEHSQATHNCSAYLIGEHDQIQKANDDGEPSGTAGVPMLEVLKKNKLKDTTVVVTRYYGGIKLGAGGLIRAYSKSTSEALKATGIVKRQLMKNISITVEYPLLGKIENELHQKNHMIVGIDYLEHVTFNVVVAVDQVESFTEWIINLTSDNATIEIKKEQYIEMPYEV